MTLHDILTVTAALAAVVAMILLARFGTRLAGVRPRRGLDRDLSLEATLALDPRRRLSLIRCEGRRLLLLTGGSGDLLLGWLPDTATPPSSDAS